MADPADVTHGILAHGVLVRVADLLRRLPADQLAALADGSAKLEVVRKGAGGGASRGAATARPAPVPAAQVRAELVRIGDRAAARRWLADQRFTVAQLVAVAKELGIAVRARARKDEVLDQLVQWTIGRRLDSAAISRPAPPPS